jgi:general secretion pathway protein A
MNQFLLRQRAMGHSALLIIDESQNLSPAVLEQVRMISNLETETDKLIQIVLMGQPELAQILALPELEQLNQRITVRYHIYPLDEAETLQYIRHRMFIAKGKVEVKFDAPGLRALFIHTGGVPRKINVLMDRILLIGYVDGTYEFNENIVQRAIAEVKGSQGFGRQTAATGRGSRPGPTYGRRWVKATLALAATAIVAGVGAVTAMQFLNQPVGSQAPQGTPVAAAPVAPPQAVIASTPLAPPSLTPPVATPAVAAVAPWTYDSSNTVRVRDAGDAWHASLLTLMSIWSQRRYDLSELRQADAPTRQQIVEAIFSELTTHGFRQVTVTGSLTRLLRAEAPMILSLEDSGGQFASHVLLLGSSIVEGEELLTIADPTHGVVEVKRADLSPLYQSQATAIFPDPEGLAEIQVGEESDRVRQLQQALIATGHLRGALTGVFDTDTREAVRDFQRDARLEATGELDPETAMHLVLATQDQEATL